MFWGLIMEPRKRYSQTVNKAFHISMAALDINSSSEEPVQVMCGSESRKYLMCTLQMGKILQCPLDLNFEVGDEVSFVCNGASHVHLTGYVNEDELDDLDYGDEDEDEGLEIGTVSTANIVSGKRPKRKVSDDSPRPAKKSKTLELLAEINSQDEDDSDDSDVDLSDALIDDDDDEESTFVEDDDSDEDDDDEEAVFAEDSDEDNDETKKLESPESPDSPDSDEELSSMSEEDEEEEEEEEAKPKVNGSSNKHPKVAPKGKKEESRGNTTPMKTPKGEMKTPKGEMKTPKGEKKTPKGEKTPKVEKPKQTPGKPAGKSPKGENSPASPQKKIIEGGVAVEDLKLGNGPVAKPGKMVQVYYEGRFKNNNKVFDSSQKGNGFKFRLGKQEVIKGWDIGVSGMKVGGKRRITCPPSMAYGTKGSLPTIPPNSTLVFDVELKNIN